VETADGPLLKKEKEAQPLFWPLVSEGTICMEGKQLKGFANESFICGFKYRLRLEKTRKPRGMFNYFMSAKIDEFRPNQ